MCAVMRWVILFLVVIDATHVIRFGPVTKPTHGIRFGPQKKRLGCEVKDETPGFKQLALNARWSLLLRQCKQLFTEGWNYILCFGSRMERYLSNGHIRQDLGKYDDTKDDYTDGYFVQHYTNGSPFNATMNHSCEVRCRCGEGEPKLTSVEYDIHTIINVTMFSCCQRVNVSQVLDSMPTSFSFVSEAGDHRFPAGTIYSMDLKFRNSTLTLRTKAGATTQHFTLGTPVFVPRLPQIATVPLASRPTLRHGQRTALFFPLEHARGGIYALCHTFWDEVISDTYLDLVQAQMHSTSTGEKPEIYIILQSLSFCSLHQLLPRQPRNIVVNCGESEEPHGEVANPET